MSDEKYTGLKPPKTAAALMDMYYLQARSYLLETAAIMDRIERAEDGSTALEDSKMDHLFDICQVLTKAKNNRAEQILNLLSV